MADESVGEAGVASTWGGMTAEQQRADLDAAYAEMRTARQAETAAAGEVTDQPETPAGAGETKETPKTPVAGDETPAGDDAAKAGTPQDGKAAESDGGGEGDDESQTKDWLDDETRDFADALGMSEADLSEVSSREEFDRLARIFNRKAFEAGKSGGQSAGQAAGQPAEQDGQQRQQQQQQAPEQRPAGSVLDNLDQYKLGEAFDAEAAKPINAFVEAAAGEIKALRAELSQIRQQRQAEMAGDIRRQAMESLDSLGHKDLFGEPGKPRTKEQTANVQKAIEAHFVHATGMFAMGRRAAPTPAFLKAAVQLAFGEQLVKNQQRQIAERLKKQSAKRTGGGVVKTMPRPKAGLSTLEQVISDPDIDAKFNQLVSEHSG